MKAPKFPSYDEAVNRKKKTNKKLLTKEEWLALEEARKQKDRDKGKRLAKHRKRALTIAFRVSQRDREAIFAKIALSGLKRQEYMTNAILSAPVQIYANQDVIDQCKEDLQEILPELKRVNRFDELQEKSQQELKMIAQIIEAALN